MSRTMLATILACLVMPLNLMAKEGRRMPDLTITSPVFAPNSPIPARYTCDRQDINPPLTVAGVPTGVKSLALVMDDPAAPGGTWLHWLVWNIPPQVREITENSVPAGVVQGTNSWRRNRYGGPVPPPALTATPSGSTPSISPCNSPLPPPSQRWKTPCKGTSLPGENWWGPIAENEPA